jgi:hypothetical protein
MPEQHAVSKSVLACGAFHALLHFPQGAAGRCVPDAGQLFQNVRRRRQDHESRSFGLHLEPQAYGQPPPDGAPHEAQRRSASLACLGYSIARGGGEIRKPSDAGSDSRRGNKAERNRWPAPARTSWKSSTSIPSPSWYTTRSGTRLLSPSKGPETPFENGRIWLKPRRPSGGRIFLLS